MRLLPLLIILIPTNLFAAESPNFSFDIRDKAYATRIVERAEACRTSQAIYWFGHSLPNWRTKCQIWFGDANGAKVTYRDRPLRNMNLIIDGKLSSDAKLDFILDHIIPHEVNHLLFADRFGVTPRWLDEGCAIHMELNEVAEERDRFHKHYPHVELCPRLRTLMQADYTNNNEVNERFYSQSSLAVEYLLQRNGPKVFVSFIEMGKNRSWTKAIKEAYGLDMQQWQRDWEEWVQNELNQGDSALQVAR